MYFKYCVTDIRIMKKLVSKKLSILTGEKID